MQAKGKLEEQLREHYDLIIGVDEVGRGCLAGDTCAAAVVLNYDRVNKLDPKIKNLIRDSKLLSKAQRQKTKAHLLADGLCSHYAVESVSAAVIDQIGIQQAIFQAMRQAIFKILSLQQNLKVIVLVDGHLKIPKLNQNFIDIEQRAIVKGDQLCYSIAASSILAKVTRDSTMDEAANAFPLFGFENHMGYGTVKHLQALKDFGPTPLHRKSFAPVACYLN